MKHITLAITLFFLFVFLSLPCKASITHGERQYKNWSSHNTRAVIHDCPSFCNIIKKYSAIYGVPKRLIIAVIQHESNFNPNALSHKGAKGLMQLMDVNSRAAGIDPYNPEQNIQVGTQLLSRLLRQYESVELALAAYNAGEGNVAKYRGIPPFKETRHYIRKVMHSYKRTI